MTPQPRRIDVYLDYFYVYQSARLAFGDPADPPLPYFGNVVPSLLAGAIAKGHIPGERRSDRSLGRHHIFFRQIDPETETNHVARLERWSAAGGVVHLIPTPEAPNARMASRIAVALTAQVVEDLVRGTCDTAVVFAGEGALLPLFTAMRGSKAPSSKIELATWVGSDGSAMSSLAEIPDIWCHRFGRRRFVAVTAPPPKRKPTTKRAQKVDRRKAAAPPSATAMSAAFQTAGLTPETFQEGAEATPTPPAMPADLAPGGLPPTPKKQRFNRLRRRLRRSE